jgi:hypothetical protein
MGFGTAGVSNSGGSGGFHVLGYTESWLERNSFDRHKSKAHLSLKALLRVDCAAISMFFYPVTPIPIGSDQCKGMVGNQTHFKKRF